MKNITGKRTTPGLRLLLILSCLSAACTDGPDPGILLSGTVRSQAEGLMEGVFINAKRIDGTVTVSVLSDAGGEWRFPAGRLSPGAYELSTSAVGYEAVQRRVEIGDDQATTIPLRLEPLQDKTRLAMQLSNTEWEMTLGSSKVRPCGNCHLIGYAMTKDYTTAMWEQTIRRMSTYGAGSAIRRHRRDVVQQPYTEEPLTSEELELAAYLSSVAGPDRLADLEFKLLPRPRGSATKVILTAYELAREDSAPHDVAVDNEGIVWHSEITLPYLGRLDPATGETRLYEVPENKAGFPPGTFDIEFDRQGNPWFGLLWQAGIGKLDKATGQVSLWQLPAKWNHDETRTAMIAVGGPDDRVWFSDNGLENFFLLDPETGDIEIYPHPDDNKSTYGVTVDSEGKAWFAGLYGNSFGKVDPVAGKVTYYTPPTPGSAPRRIQTDSRDRVWFAEFRGNKLAMFDQDTESFREWDLPSPYAGAYDVAPSSDGEVVWLSGSYDDRIYRLDDVTGEISWYAWPRPYPNVQRMAVDPTRDTRRSVWIAEDHYGMATLLEILPE